MFQDAEMAGEVSISSCQVRLDGRHSPAYSELVRSLASFSRAIVKYAPYQASLREAAQAALEQAQMKVLADGGNISQARRPGLRDWGRITEKGKATISRKQVPAGTESADEQFVDSVSSLIRAKIKQIKQHSRRAAKRAEKHPQKHRTTQVPWPPALVKVAADINHWEFDIFMFVAAQVAARYMEQQGATVSIDDGYDDYLAAINRQDCGCMRRSVQVLLRDHWQEVGCKGV